MVYTRLSLVPESSRDLFGVSEVGDPETDASREEKIVKGVGETDLLRTGSKYLVEQVGGHYYPITEVGNGH